MNTLEHWKEVKTQQTIHRLRRKTLWICIYDNENVLSKQNTDICFDQTITWICWTCSSFHGNSLCLQRGPHKVESCTDIDNGSSIDCMVDVDIQLPAKWYSCLLLKFRAFVVVPRHCNRRCRWIQLPVPCNRTPYPLWYFPAII